MGGVVARTAKRGINMNSDQDDRSKEIYEEWEEVVFPKAVFGKDFDSFSSEDAFHLFGIVSAPSLLPAASLKETVLRSVKKDKTFPNTTSESPATAPYRNLPDADGFSFVIGSRKDVWRRSSIAGVDYKILNYDRLRDAVTLVIRMSPGAVFPGHTHRSAENCYLIAGDLNIAEHTLRAGDFHRAESGSEHDTFTTISGAEFLIVAGASDFSEF
uniref:ChrR-like cupin domain-containing protein n=3 Tax=Leptospira ellisii TaxID=2023197 RepID=A0A2N0B768_9LEPT|nr:hypothetical protein CH379_13390 [Leptospira ellisii]